jgi:hypothetical protein
MLRTCGWIEGGSRVVLEQVVAIGAEHSRNVRAGMSRSTNNDAVSYPHLAELSRVLNFDLNVSTRSIGTYRITIDGAKDEINSST